MAGTSYYKSRATRLNNRKTMTPAAMEANRANAKLGGRPKGYGHLQRQHIVDLARKTGPECIATLTFEMRHCDNPAVRVACARELLDRGFGKPSHKLESTSGAMLNMLQVITGVPDPEPDSQEDSPIQIEGEIIGD